MEAKKGDYILVNAQLEDDAKEKVCLWRVTDTSGKGNLTARLEKDPHLSPLVRSWYKDQVIANLGSRPPEGKAFGYDLSNLYKGKVRTKNNVEIAVFGNPTRAHIERIRGNLNAAHKTLKSKRLGFLFDQHNVFTMRRGTGKYAGWFERSRDLNKRPHQTAYFWNARMVGENTQLRYLIYHEIGHLVESLFMDQYPELVSQWQRLYDTTVEPVRVPKESRVDLLQSLITEETSVSRWLKSVGDHEKENARAILRWLRSNVSVSNRDIDYLLQAGATDEISNIWPVDHPVPLPRNIKPLVSEYATVHRAELFAECFAFHFSGENLPKRASALLQKTLSFVIKQYG